MSWGEPKGPVKEFTLSCEAERELPKALAEIERLKSELGLLSARHTAQKKGTKPRCWGRSSDALVWASIYPWLEVPENEYPLDPSDLAACIRTYEMAPDHLKPRMEPILIRFEKAVQKRYPKADASADYAGGAA